MAWKRRVQLIVVITLLLFVVTVAGAQETPPSVLYVTESSTESLPTVTLRAYGLDGEGAPLDLAQTPLLLTHDGEAVEAVEVGREVPVGAFTVFLVDITPGVSDQIPAVQEAIERFASEPYMQEQLDTVAIYRVGESDAVSLLAPTEFYNSVRNFFATPLEPHSGPTALIDSTVNLLNEVGNLNADPARFASIVVFSDGTDAVSTQYQPEDVATRAAELGIPVHTVWLQNEELTVGQEAGRTYLAQVAQASRGTAARLDQPDTLTPIFERIAALRNQQLLYYNLPAAEGGTATVALSLADEPEVQAQTEVSVDVAAPTVSLNIPPESRSLTLPNLDEPVRLRFSADVSWLDEQERALESARLLINGVAVADVPTANLADFEAEIDNFVFGANPARLTVVDEQGLQGVSPEILLTVSQGDREIPEALQSGNAFLVSALPFCLGGLLLLALFGAGGFFAYRSGRLPSLRRARPRRREVSPAPEPAVAVAGPPIQEVPIPGGPAYLEVLETETAMPAHIPLEDEEVTLGRSPSLVQVAFERDITVSRQHATILWDGHAYRIYDDNSSSGTYVNDQEVPDYGIQLFNGDDIFLGKVHLRFRR